MDGPFCKHFYTDICPSGKFPSTRPGSQDSHVQELRFQGHIYGLFEHTSCNKTRDMAQYSDSLEFSLESMKLPLLCYRRMFQIKENKRVINYTTLFELRENEHANNLLSLSASQDECYK